MKLKFTQSNNIKLYKPILEGMEDVWEYEHYPYILSWCTKNRPKDKYWQVWLIKNKKNIIGICGMYSLKETNEELWGGWGGFLPQYRNQGLGTQINNFKVEEAKKVGAKRLISYVGEDGKALNYFYKNGYVRLCSTGEYLEKNPELANEFGNLNDHVLIKELSYEDINKN